jgi:hypothetical protein
MVLFSWKIADNFLMKEEKNIVKYNLRIPKYLYDKVCLKAAENRRSVNNEIIAGIAQYVADYDGSPTIFDVYQLIEELLKKLDK